MMLPRHLAVWTWPDDTGHIWEALSPPLSCIHKQLKIKAFLEETSCGSIKLVSCKSFKINYARRKMWNCKFPHVSIHAADDFSSFLRYTLGQFLMQGGW